MMIKGKTQTGFEFNVDSRCIKDFRFVKSYKMTKSKNADESSDGIMKLIELVCGNYEDELLEHVASLNDGYVPMPALMAEFNDIVSALNEGDSEAKK